MNRSIKVQVLAWLKHGFLCVFLLSLLNVQVFSQGSPWQDGFPLFEKISETRNVRVDSLIQLAPFLGEFQENAEFQFILDGFDWRWPENNPRLGHPASEDIDYRIAIDPANPDSGTLNLYIITDGNGHRIIEVNPDMMEEEIWQFGSSNPSSPNYLDHPVATFPYEENGIKKYLITDMLQHQVLIVADSKFITWSYGDKTPGDEPFQLNHPSDAVRLPDVSQVLICDQGNNRVIIVNQSDGSIAWEWGGGLGGVLKVPVDVDYIAATEEVLITDQKNHRVILVSVPQDEIVFQFGTGQADTSRNGLNNPTDADMLPNGNIMISDSSNQRLIEVNRAGNIVWQFHRPLKGLKDADMLPDNHIIIIADSAHLRSWPFRLGYADDVQISEIHVLDRNVNLDSLFLTMETRADTTMLRVKIRSVSQDEDIESATWYGPTSESDFYNAPANAINSIHQGDFKFQLRAELLTNDPHYTPALNHARVTYHFFHEDSVAYASSETIADSSNIIITSWDSLSFHTIIPKQALQRDQVQIQIEVLNALTNNPVMDPIEVSPFTEEQGIRLSGNTGWHGEGVQQLRLKAILHTQNASISPILKDWQVEWSTTRASISQIDFVDSKFRPVDYYHITREHDQENLDFADLVRIRLVDNNLSETQSSIKLNIRVRSSSPGELDSAVVELTRQPETNYFLNISGMRAFISEVLPDPDDKMLQVHNRDTLIIDYQDPSDPSDQSHAQVIIIENTAATIQIENSDFQPIETASIRDTIFVRLLNEQDQNLSPELQDTVQVEVTDTETRDREMLILVEVQDDSTGLYDTGEFISLPGIILVQNPTGFPADGEIQTLPHNQVSAHYADNSEPEPVASITIQSLPDSLIIPLSGLYDFTIAPNPFYADRHESLRLRAFSTIGALNLTKVEIFNIAGEKVRTINGPDVFASPLVEDEIRFAENWWNLTNDNGNEVSSGTYWIKFSADLTNMTEGTSQTIHSIKKVLIIR